MDREKSESYIGLREKIKSFKSRFSFIAPLIFFVAVLGFVVFVTNFILLNAGYNYEVPYSSSFRYVLVVLIIGTTFDMFYVENIISKIFEE